MPSGGRDRIPAYALYGEDGALPDSVHAETIEARSSRLDWRIGAHRHATLYQALLIRDGSANASIEGRSLLLGPGTLAWVPPLTVHAYDFAPRTVGVVVSMPATVLAGALNGIDEFRRTLDGPLVIADGGGIEVRVLAVLDEFLARRPGHEQALAAQATLLAISVARDGLRAAPPLEVRGDRALVRRFLDAVEDSFGERRALSAYAQALGLSVSHLSRTCRAVTGRAPLRLIHDRRLIEAKRDLVYTDLPIHLLAERLGFDSPAYFSRFFKERTGTSPQAFRRASGTLPPAAKEVRRSLAPET